MALISALISYIFAIYFIDYYIGWRSIFFVLCWRVSVYLIVDIYTVNNMYPGEIFL